MAQESIDCRGLACPGPVLKTKEIVDRGDTERVTVLVDNSAARENVARFLTRSGYQVDVVERDGLFEVMGCSSEPMSYEIMVEEQEVPPEKLKIMVLLGNNRMGRGDDELGRKLINNFLATLKEMGEELWRLVLLNSGVKLAIEGSEVLTTLQDLENDGVHLLVCGTCLDHFGLLEQKRVGETTNMLDIVTAMQLADKVISLT
ncbi:MAG: sulfurtransferase-like selenium metabolism protein YedF [Syntrophobacteria bacterium]